MNNIKIKKDTFTLKDFQAMFPTDDACLHSLFEARYNNHTHCSNCNNKFSYYKVSNRKCYACAYCGHQLHPTADTIFHKSSTSLVDWFYSIYLFSVSKNGVSAKELERQLGCTYKTAWRIANKIRSLMDDGTNPLSNIVEIDETYFGGKESNKHKDKKTPHSQGRNNQSKTPIIGAVEREGNIKTSVVSDTTTNTINQFATNNISKQATINTDEYRSYNKISAQGFNHNRVNHSLKQYVLGNNHTNTIVGFWSQLKISVRGTYINVSTKYLQDYVNEFAFRYNLRNATCHDFFSLLPLASRTYSTK